MESLRKQDVTLVITGDCGISSYSEVERAQEMGLDIIITDHHTVPSTIPPAIAAINPKRADSRYPLKDLAGVGVAFKLVQALVEAADRQFDPDQLLDLVALGTVADLVPLTGENRYLVKRGLEILNQTNRLGLREMAGCASVHLGDLDTQSIAYVLGPRLNAAGRLDHAIISYQLLRTTSPEEARRLALMLEEKNSERQRLTAEVLGDAKNKLLPFDPEVPLLMAGGENYSPGVIGVVAGKLAEEFYRPVIVLQLGETECRGSARSIPEFNVIAAISQCQELLSRFGGHAQAAGFTIPNGNLESFHHQLTEIAASELAGLDLRPTLGIDAESPLSSLQEKDTFRQITSLAPFGNANPAPTFLTRGVTVLDYRSVGSKRDHLRLKLRDGNATWHAIAFGLGNFAGHITPRIDVVYNIEVEDWSGTKLLQLNVLDFAPVS